MRFANLITLIATVTSITCALQDVGARDTLVVKADSQQSSHGSSSVKRHPRDLRIVPRALSEDKVGMDDGIWHVMESGYLPAKEVKPGQIIQIDDLTGCTALYFFDGHGKSSAAHLCASEVNTEAVEAAKKAKAEGLTRTVVIGAPSKSTFETAEKLIKSVIEEITAIDKNYGYTGSNRRLLTRYIYTAGKSSSTVTYETYDGSP